MNNAVFSGFVGSEPKFFEKFARFSVNVSSGKDKSFWIDVFSNSVEYVKQHIHKGTLVYVSGFLSVSSYEVPGEKRMSIALHSNVIDFVNRDTQMVDASTGEVID